MPAPPPRPTAATIPQAATHASLQTTPQTSPQTSPRTTVPAPDVLVVGSLNVDLSLQVDRRPRPGETVVGRDAARSPGGKGANQALAASRAGARTAMIGAVGADASGAGDAEVALSLLADDGVDLSGVSRVEGPTGLAVVTVDRSGENTIVVVPGANGAVDAAMVRSHAGAISSAAVVVLQGEIPRSGIEEAARLCRGRLVLNPAPVLELDSDVLRAADPLVVNEHEAAAVLEQLLAPGPRPAEGARSLLRSLLEAGVRSAVLTLGGEGALVGDGTVRAIPAAEVAAVDTTGAGDAFIGALAARLARGDGLLAAARHGSRFAAASVTAPGAQSSYPQRGAGLPVLPPSARNDDESARSDDGPARHDGEGH